MRSTFLLGAVLGIVVDCTAQLPTDYFLTVGYNIQRNLPPDAYFLPPWFGPVRIGSWPSAVRNSTAIAVESETVLYAAEPASVWPAYGQYTFYRATVGANEGITSVQTLGTFNNPTGGAITALTVAGDRLWFATRGSTIQPADALVGNLSKNQPNQLVTASLDLGQLGYGQEFFEARSNGRDVYLWGFATASATATILELDTSYSPPTIRTRAYEFHPELHNGWFLGYTTIGPQLWQYTEVDPWDGTATPIPGALYRNAFDSVAYNPWTRVLMLRYFGLIGSDFWIVTPSSGQIQQAWSTLQNGWGAHLISLHEEPAVIYGRGCPNATGRDPRMAWSGLPERGGSLTMRLRDAEASSLAVFWLGTSRTTWNGAPLPLDGAMFGAPGCTLLAAPDLWVATFTDRNGKARITLPFPNDPVVHGLELAAQTASATLANPVGFATSEALALRCR